VFQREELSMNDLSGRRIAWAVSEKYLTGTDLLIGQNDSFEFLKTIHDKIVKLIVTSPPYNIGKVYEEGGKLDEYLLKDR
jgi:adenine-specific DNA-methyltransferase